MQHDRALTRTIIGHVFEVETFGKIEIALDRAELPRAADCILDVDVDLGAIERRVALLHRILKAVLFECVLQRRGGLVPDFVAPDVLVGILRAEIRGELGEAEGTQNAHHEIKK